MRSTAQHAVPSPVAESSALPTRQWQWLTGLFLFLSTLLLYWPSYRAGFIWDDRLLLENPLVQGSWAGLRDIWTTKKFPDFCPVTATSFWLEAQCGGATSLVRHTTNILLQGFNVVLLWLVLRRLNIFGAWMIAALFAAHPLCVTSVTWVAERKNTLSMFFYLLSFLLYLRSAKTAEPNATSPFRQTSFWLSFVFYIAALLSKTSTVVLPVVFLLCAWWQHGKISRPDIGRVLPFFGLAFAAGLTTLIAHYFFGPKDGVADNLLVRVLAATKAIWFYLSKALVPINLTMHYGRWEIDPRSFMSYLPGLGLAAVLTLCWRFRQTWGKHCLFGLGYFILALGPTLGIAKMTFLKFSQVADHFQFLALPGLIALVAGGIFHWVKKAQGLPATKILFVAMISPLAFLSWKHQRIIGDAETMWRDNIQKNPQSWLANNCVADALQARGQLREAESYYRQAIEMRPDYLDALSNLGVLLGGMGRLPEAIECYRKAIAFNPNIAPIHFNLGTALYSQGQFSDAIAPLTKAMELNPTDSQYHNNLASALMQLGKLDHVTLSHLREAVRLNPANAEAQSNLGLLLSRQGKNREAEAQYEQALGLDPANATAHYYFGRQLNAYGKSDEALKHFFAVTQLQPDNALAHTGLADILARQGKQPEATAHRAMAGFLQGRELVNKNKTAEAKEQFRKALKMDAPAVLELAGKVCTLSAPNSFPILDALATLCAESGRSTDTTNALQKVITLAESAGQTEVVEKYRALLERYRPGAVPPMLRRPE